MSDCGRYSIVAIFCVGFVFSPSYAAARRLGRADPTAHVAVNVVVHDRHRRVVWAMNERGSDARRASRHALTLGRSQLSCDEKGVSVALDEPETAFFGRKKGHLVGTLRLDAEQGAAPSVKLADGHAWRAFIPSGRIRVELPSHGISFGGDGYLDANRGVEPLERAFSKWSWVRRRRGDRVDVVYDVHPRQGERRAFLLSGDRHHVAVSEVAHVRTRATQRTGFGLEIDSLEVGGAPSSRRPPSRIFVEPTVVIDDTPFYARYRIAGGEGLGETLDLDRFENRFVQHLLGYRIHRERRRAPGRLADR